MIGFETRIAGIPCTVRINAVQHKRLESEEMTNLNIGASTRVDVNYTVCDRRGRPAPWLARKMSGRVREEIEREVMSYV